jgi:hypothetical protein
MAINKVTFTPSYMKINQLNKNVVFWDVTPCDSCYNRRFGGTLVLLHSVLQLLVTTNFPSSLILSTLFVEAICSSERSVLTRATRRHSPDDGIPHSHRR